MDSENQTAKGRVLVIDKMHDSIIPLLNKIGYGVDIQLDLDKKKLIDIVGNYQGLILRSKIFLDDDIISNSNLKFIARAGAGTDNIDIEAVENSKVKIINAPEGNKDTLAEHTLGMLLNLTNKINSANNEVKNGLWKREANRGIELMGKTIGIIGFGHMGEAFANKLSGLGVKILAYDKYRNHFTNEQVKESSLEQLYADSDILSIHVPLTVETRYKFNKTFFSRFHKDIILLNTSRGEVLILKDLVDLLNEGKIIAAGLDVLENEKLDSLTESQKSVFNDLVKFDNVIITPHVGGWSHESYERINHVLADKIKALQS